MSLAFVGRAMPAPPAMEPPPRSRRMIHETTRKTRSVGLDRFRVVWAAQAYWSRTMQPIPRNVTAIAAALSAMFASGMAHAEGKPDKSSAATITCYGGNACKGQSACATAKSSCKAQNACKGQGFTMTTSVKACSDLGGRVVAVL
jgi:uncharacterized membrane protein